MEDFDAPSLGMFLVKASPMLALALPPWERAMVSCFHFELAVRLLAQKFFAGDSVTRDIATGKKGEGLLPMLFRKIAFRQEEIALLPKCNTLRNKLIHCEPDAVLKIVQELVPKFDPPNLVHQIDFPTDASGSDNLKALTTPNGAIPVKDTSSRQEGFAGWMIQAAGDGTFDRASGIVRYGAWIMNAKAEAS